MDQSHEQSRVATIREFLEMSENLANVREKSGKFGLINVNLFDVLPAISSEKVGDFYVWSGEL